MSAPGYARLLAAPAGDRRDLFLATAQRLGTPIGNVEKDFWVCWTLDVLYHHLPAGGPRLLFKGGTALSKAHGIIRRFSEDIDITVFRDDLAVPATVAAMEALSGRQRRARLDAIRDACRMYIQQSLRAALAARVADATRGAGRVDIDTDDADGQTLLVAYPTLDGDGDAYVRPVVRIEAGAKSALDPHSLVTLRPYVADEVPDIDLTVHGVTTIDAVRTMWDKLVITHGLRRWYERRGVLRHEGQRVSRHYYDLHCLLQSAHGRAALADRALGADCVRHARMFFDRPDYDLASAVPGTFAVTPVDGMLDALARDYAAMRAMIFGTPPTFDAVLDSVRRIDALVNGR